MGTIDQLRVQQIIASPVCLRFAFDAHLLGWYLYISTHFVSG